MVNFVKMFTTSLSHWFSGQEFTKCLSNNKQGKPWSDCFFRSSLIRICTVCLGLFCRELEFEILENLPYSSQSILIFLKKTFRNTISARQFGSRSDLQGSKNPLVRSYLRVPQAAGQVVFWMISNVN